MFDSRIGFICFIIYMWGYWDKINKLLTGHEFANSKKSVGRVVTDWKFWLSIVRNRLMKTPLTTLIMLWKLRNLVSQKSITIKKLDHFYVIYHIHRSLIHLAPNLTQTEIHDKCQGGTMYAFARKGTCYALPKGNIHMTIFLVNNYKYCWAHPVAIIVHTLYIPTSLDF